MLMKPGVWTDGTPCQVCLFDSWREVCGIVWQFGHKNTVMHVPTSLTVGGGQRGQCGCVWTCLGQV